jgi:integrase
MLTRTLPVLYPIMRAMVAFQLFTGARPGEIIRLRPRDFDRSGKVELMPGFHTDTGTSIWSVRLEHHKTIHRGHHRVLLVGPMAQEAIALLLEGRDPNAFLFSPQEAMTWWQGEKRKRRRSKVQPSQKDRRKQKTYKLPAPPTPYIATAVRCATPSRRPTRQRRASRARS